MKHQLKTGTYCVPKDKNQCIEILTLAQERGLIYNQGYTIGVLRGDKDWPCDLFSIPKAVNFSGIFVSAFAAYRDVKIPVDEFIARLKGEYQKTT